MPFKPLQLSLQYRKKFYSKFKNRPPRSGEDLAVYKWELEILLAKADPELSNDAKTALIQRQFMKGLPDTIKHRLLEHNPTPNLEEMLSIHFNFTSLMTRLLLTQFLSLIFCSKIAILGVLLCYTVSARFQKI